MSRVIQSICCLILITFFFSCFALSAQQAPKRLVLKDGSYQLTTKWEIKGDRVRFYSAERYDWEELPSMLVDWPATERFNREAEADRAAGMIKLDEEAAPDQPVAAPDAPLVAPGWSLAEDGGVFLIDTYQGHAQLVPLEQNSGELNKHMGRNIMRAAINPLALSSKQTVELPGAHSAVQAHVTQPVFYIDLGPGESSEAAQRTDAQKTPAAPNVSSPQDHYRIARMQVKKDIRVLGKLNIAVTGKISNKESWVPTTSAPVGQWIKITCDEPLAQGEYAIVELLDRGQINLYVWDFGVDAAAPANRNAQSPREPAPAGKTEQPSLEPRAK